MAVNSKIDWTDHTWNPWYGCTKCSPACDNCYAEDWAKRYGKKFNQINPTSKSTFQAPLNRNKYKSGDVVFIESLGDFFHEDVPVELRNAAYEIIDARPDLKWLFLTKRIDLVNESNWHGKENHGLGVTICNQAEADAKIPVLLSIPAAMRFVSIEPMLGEIDLNNPDAGAEEDWKCVDCGRWYQHYPAGWGCNCGSTARHGAYRCQLDWVIVGGESGHNARPLHPDWVRNIQKQCADAGVPFFFKQWGSKPHSHAFKMGVPTGQMRLPKGGHMLDGKEYRQYPEWVGRI